MVSALSTWTLNSEISVHPGSLIKLDDTRSLLTRITDLSTAEINEQYSRRLRESNPLRRRAMEIFPLLLATASGMHYDEDNQPGKEGRSRVLLVFIHGLNSSPLAWSNYLNDFPLDNPETSCFIPYVYKKGYCKLKKAALPILKVVQNYSDRYPSNPIFLIGHSNGARIAAYIEQKLNAKFIRLISIAGPHCGTQLVNRISMLGLDTCFGFTSKMTKEFLYKGPFAIKKLVKWQSRLEMYARTQKSVKRIFFASVDDWRIYPNDTSFPALPGSQYVLVRGESHVTIIDSLRTSVSQFIVQQVNDIRN